MYTNQVAVESRLGSQLTPEQAVYFEKLSAGTDIYINRLTGTEFGSDEIVDVYIDGEKSANLVIPTMHDITAVTQIADDGSETVLPVGDYRLWPSGRPDTYAIRHIGGSWEEGTERYKITGKLGYKDVPADIANAATDMIVGNLTANTTNLKSERVGDWSATYKDSGESLSADSLTTINSYQRLSRSL